jgi:hypothetical protein
MKKNQFGFGDQESKTALFKTMEEGEYKGDTLQNVMEDIQDFLYASYSLGINPLKGLRGILPQYSWKYCHLDNHQQIKDVIAGSDFIWRIWHTDDGFQLVTATKLDRVKYLRCFWAETKKDQGDQISFIESFGGDPVYWTIEN